MWCFFFFLTWVGWVVKPARSTPTGGGRTIASCKLFLQLPELVGWAASGRNCDFKPFYIVHIHSHYCTCSVRIIQLELWQFLKWGHVKSYSSSSLDTKWSHLTSNCLLLKADIFTPIQSTVDFTALPYWLLGGLVTTTDLSVLCRSRFFGMLLIWSFLGGRGWALVFDRQFRIVGH